MTQYINSARWQNKLRAMLGIDGENPIPTVKELVPTAVVEQDRIEWGAAAGETRWMAEQGQLAGGAANSGLFALLNPTGSGVLAVVELVAAVCAGGSVELTIAAEATILATFAQAVTNVIPRDTAFILNTRPACTLWTRNNLPPLGGPGFRFQNAAPPARDFLILRPGAGFVLQDPTLNEAVTFSWAWRERPLESGTLG